MSDLVGNPEDRFSHNEAQIVLCHVGVDMRKITTISCLVQCGSAVRKLALTRSFDYLGHLCIII